MPARKHNRDLIIGDYLEARAADPSLSLKKYCETKGLNYKYWHRIIGRQVVDAWDRIKARMRSKAEKKVGDTLASTLSKMAEASRALFVQGMEKVLATESNKGKPAFTPADFKEALAQVTAGNVGYLQAVQTLTGRQPIIQPEEVPYEIEWTPPSPKEMKRFKTKLKVTAQPGNGKVNGRVKRNGKVNGRKRK